jgi:O-antigen/teichoic acid export membrane protein
MPGSSRSDMFAAILRSSAFSGVASVASYLLLILLARADSPEVFAEFSYAVVCGLILVMVIDCAADQCGSNYLYTGGRSEFEAISAILRLKIIVATLAVILIVVANEAGIGFAIPYSALLFVLPAFYLGPVFELRGRNVMFAIFVACEKIALLGICIVYISLVGFDLGVYLAYFFVSVVSLVLQYRVIGPLQLSLASDFGGVSRDYLLRYWPVYLSLFAYASYGHASRLIIEARRGLIVFAAVSLALQTLNSVSIAQSQVDRHFRPAINRAASGSGAQSLGSLLGRYLSWYVVPLAVAALATVYFADEIVRLLFGPEWSSAAIALEALAPVLVTVPILRFLEMVAVAVRKPKVSLGVNVTFAVALLATLSLIPTGWPLTVWLRVIVALQALHVLTLGFLLRDSFKVGFGR